MDNALLHRQAQRSAVTDPLTGVGNLRMLTTTLAREVERARHFGRSVALLVIDIDHFREINDRHGHTAGDAILAAVAARIVGSVREVDRVARYGGEEFAVVGPGAGPRAGLRDGAERVERRPGRAVRRPRAPRWRSGSVSASRPGRARRRPRPSCCGRRMRPWPRPRPADVTMCGRRRTLSG